MGCNSGLTNTVAMPSWFQSTHYFLKAPFSGNICFGLLGACRKCRGHRSQGFSPTFTSSWNSPWKLSRPSRDWILSLDSVHQFPDSCHPLQLWVVLSVMLTLIIFNYHIYSPIILVVGFVMINLGMIQDFFKHAPKKSITNGFILPLV